MSTTTTSQLVKERIEHLWNLVLETTSSPSYSKYLSKMIFRLAQDNDIKIQPTFFQMVCPCCYSFFLPGKNCIQNLWSIAKIRRLKEKKKEFNQILYSSQLSRGSNEKKIKKPNAIFSTFKCKACKTLIVYDTAPLDFNEIKDVAQVKSKSVNPAKKDNLQKVLQKSQVPKTSDSYKKEMDLESFLKGFL